MLSSSLARLLGAAALLAASGSQAQGYPNRPVTIVVPYPAGGPVDNFARALAQGLGDTWRQPVIVMNKPGANEIIGADTVAKSQPDGYTLFAGTEAALTMSPHLYKKLPYSVEKDFVPISRMVSLPLVFFVSSSLPVETMQDFVKLAKTRAAADKPLSYGSTGGGGIAHLPIVTLERQEGISLTHVPYRGASNLIPDVISGEVDAAVLGVSVIEQHVRKQMLKALAISAPSRSASLPEVPTFTQAGLQDIQAVFNIGLLAPRGTPPDLVSKIAADVREVIADPEFRRKNIDAYSYVPVAGDPAEFKAFLESDSRIQADRIKASGVTLN
ncbi:Bug family tripartite tricarboxylate transporter substrate binding protein [Bordetella trematum]|uniref:Bug family tripartite tricarboxylate transporter substrate binding protein n=1 Tax=Bordetella trematum TaxID=123899 RepID=UPI003AF3A8E5